MEVSVLSAKRRGMHLVRKGVEKCDNGGDGGADTPAAEEQPCVVIVRCRVCFIDGDGGNEAL
jgi:hypothetical protein